MRRDDHDGRRHDGRRWRHVRPGAARRASRSACWRRATALAELAAGQQRGIALAIEDIAAAGGVLGGSWPRCVVDESVDEPIETTRRIAGRHRAPTRSSAPSARRRRWRWPRSPATSDCSSARRRRRRLGHLRGHRGVVLPHRDPRRRHGGRRRRRDHGRRRRRGGRRAAAEHRHPRARRRLRRRARRRPVGAAHRPRRHGRHDPVPVPPRRVHRGGRGRRSPPIPTSSSWCRSPRASTCSPSSPPPATRWRRSSASTGCRGPTSPRSSSRTTRPRPTGCASCAPRATA